MKKHTKKKLKKQIAYYEKRILDTDVDDKGKEKMSKCITRLKQWLSEKEEDNTYSAKDLIAHILKINTEVFIKLVRGENHIIVISSEGEYKFKLKYDGMETTSYINHNKTRQFKILNMLGFETINGRNYQFKTEKFIVWIQMKNSAINKIKCDDILLNELIFKLSRREGVKLVIRKGLTINERNIYPSKFNHTLILGEIG